TWRDAEDGELHGGAITEGSVDSTIAVHGSGEFEFYYWIGTGTSHKEVAELNGSVLGNTPQTYFSESSKQQFEDINLSGVSEGVATLFSRSLLIVESQIDHGGAIIAANDHDVTERATDHYSYLWPRDGAFVANALDRVGRNDITRKFYELCGRIIHERGYFLQKYNADGTVGSGWHAYWDKYRSVEMLPIQEDETALVLWALWEHYEKFSDHEFIESHYKFLIVKAADFLAGYRDEATGLPKPSWNIWEDRRGAHTFTCSTVVAGLRAAANFADVFEDAERASNYRTAADEIVAGMQKHLFSEQLGRFLRSLQSNGDESLTPDQTVDASMFAVFYFGCFAVDDPMVVGTMNAIEQKLTNADGGVARFENDGYMLESDGIVGNSWIICTLWLAEYKIAIGDLDAAEKLIEWVVDQALPSGVLPEQVDPVTVKHLSVSPLTWSHSTFVATVLSYVNKQRTQKE
nr:glycoside hydrolase family 15 protein [Pyrinomonadaceae bacterium]